MKEKISKDSQMTFLKLDFTFEWFADSFVPLIVNVRMSRLLMAVIYFSLSKKEIRTPDLQSNICWLWDLCQGFLKFTIIPQGWKSPLALTGSQDLDKKNWNQRKAVIKIWNIARAN